MERKMGGLREMMTRPDGYKALAMGNHALARAMLESGTRVITSYPGSPTPEIAEALLSVPEAERHFHFQFSVNEKVALEIAAGASLNGHPAAVFFKSVGLNVAMDSLIQQPLMEHPGGLVVILGDDPGVNSSQNEQDNRHFARMAYMPMFEPASPAEAYEMFKEASRLARKHRCAVALRLTTHVCHAREEVSFSELPSAGPDWTPRFDPKNGPYVPITAAVFPLKKRALEKLAAFEEYGNHSSFNSVIPAARDGEKGLGVISSGLPAFCALEAAGGKPVDVLKLGLTFPLPRRLLSDFMKGREEVLVVEELDRVLETEIKALAYEQGLRCRVLSRQSPDELLGETTPERAAALLAAAWPDLFKPVKAKREAPKAPGRLAQMCPGCGHRSAFHAVKHALPPGAITVGDIGCHSLGYLPPYNMGEVLFSMGHSVSTGSGLALGNVSRKVVSFLGDSTLFHAALPGIVNAVVQDSPVTLVILENGTTAMTGHQPRPGTGEVGDKIPLVPMLQALGVKFIRESDAYDQKAVAANLKEAMAHNGFAVVIARHPCMLKFMREARARTPGLRTGRAAVDQGKCARHYVCSGDFACPSFVRAEDGSVTVHPELCIGDGSCVQTCPAGAIYREKGE